jgi:hypothetical protein
MDAHGATIRWNRFPVLVTPGRGIIDRSGKDNMAELQRRNWRELCSAALGAKDPDELLQIVQELNKVLKREEQVRRDFRDAMRSTKSPEPIRG